MAFEVKAIILVIFIVINLLFLLDRKSLISSCLGIVLSGLALIWLASVTIANQGLFKDFVVYLMIFLIFFVLLVVAIETLGVNKKSLGLRFNPAIGGVISFSLIFGAIISMITFLVLIGPEKYNKPINADIIEEVDVNNSSLAQANLQSKTSLLDEKSFVIKLFYGFEKVVIFTIFLFSFLLLFVNYKEIFIGKK
jgi:hypothetical protein